MRSIDIYRLPRRSRTASPTPSERVRVRQHNAQERPASNTLTCCPGSRFRLLFYRHNATGAVCASTLRVRSTSTGRSATPGRSARPPKRWRYWSINSIKTSIGGRAPPGRQSARELQDLVGPTQLAILALKLLDALFLCSRDARPAALSDLRLPQPATQGLRGTTDLAGNRTDRRPLRLVLANVLQDHTQRTLLHFR